MRSFARPRCFARAATAHLLAAALSAAAAVIAAAEDNQAPSAVTATTAPSPDKNAPAAAPTQTPSTDKNAPAAAPTPTPNVATAPPAPDAPSPSTSSSPSQPPAASKPGFFDALGRWWQQGADDWNAKMKDARQKVDDFNKQQTQAAKDAATAIVRLPNTRVVEMHERCAKAANGAPDCIAATIAACKAKGFNTGKPADVSSSETCESTMWLSGANRNDTPCRVETETIVIRAVCQ
jgi:type IV secretory pathway VirB10-like protein